MSKTRPVPGDLLKFSASVPILNGDTRGADDHAIHEAQLEAKSWARVHMRGLSWIHVETLGQLQDLRDPPYSKATITKRVVTRAQVDAWNRRLHA